MRAGNKSLQSLLKQIYIHKHLVMTMQNGEFNSPPPPHTPPRSHTPTHTHSLTHTHTHTHTHTKHPTPPRCNSLMHTHLALKVRDHTKCTHVHCVCTCIHTFLYMYTSVCHINWKYLPHIHVNVYITYQQPTCSSVPELNLRSRRSCYHST